MGLTDDIVEYKQEIDEMLKLLLEMAKGEKKSPEEIAEWIRKNYPELCWECRTDGHSGNFCDNCGADLRES